MAVSMSNDKLRPETIAAQALHAVDKTTGAVVPPINLATTFARDENYELREGNIYQRDGHPLLQQAEGAINLLEQGHAALLFASGMAACSAMFETIPHGAHVVAQDVMYHGVRAALQRLELLGRIRLTLCKANDPVQLSEAVSSGKTDLVWIETPSNPTWDVTSIEESARIAHAAGAELIVDATMLAAVTTQPLSLGADYVFHSVTKYLNGHSDVLAGALVAREATDRWNQIEPLRSRLGSPLPPFECWLLMRGMRTLFVRYRQASENAMAIARHFEKHPRVAGVLYPGLASHPGHAIASREMRNGYGGMLSLLLTGGFAEAQRFCKRLQLVIPATSLGGVETLAEHRKAIEGPSSPVPDNLVRISVGLEHVDDLIGDIDQALG
jgi:cystathionine gamma-synthase